MANPDLIKNYKAGGAISKFRIVKFGAADGEILQAAAASDKVIGVSDAFDLATGECGDVIRSGLAPVEAGAAFARGDLLMSDAQGRAIVATAAAGTNVRVVGVAEAAAAAAGDIVDVQINPASFQG